MDDPLAPFRSELRAYCYRMTGSVHETEDVLQEISLRVVRGQEDFEGRASRRTWLYRIATNTCLNELARKERRVLPARLGPAETGSVGDLSETRAEIMWLEPFPDDPEQSAVDRESLELAFVAAIQHLTPNQRAALILSEVLGYTAREVADLLDTTAGSVSSALRRAREALTEHLPEGGRRPALHELGHAGERELVRRYTTALRSHDVQGLLDLVTDDATWSMPPLPVWFRGHTAIAAFLGTGPFTVSWRHRTTYANGLPAVAAYAWDVDTRCFQAYAIDVLEPRGDKIAAIVSFLNADLFPAFDLPDTLPADGPDRPEPEQRAQPRVSSNPS